MRKHDVRKWLHAILDLLPVIIIPVFMIYSHRHQIDSYSIDVSQNEVVDFNQNAKELNSNNYRSYDNSSYQVTFSDNSSVVVYIADIGYGEEVVSSYYVDIDITHKYLVSLEILNNPDDYGLVFRFNDKNTVVPLSNTIGLNQKIFTPSDDGLVSLAVGIYNNVSEGYSYSFSNLQLFDLTQMFGSGNEPTIEQFNTYFTNDYYDYVVSRKELLKNVGTITYNDTDIGSQMLYCLYNSVDKYFNLNNVFGFNNVYDWLSLNIFNGNPPIAIYIVWNIALYEFLMDLIMLLYALFMWFIDMCESLIDRSFHVASGRKK